ncbi:MAG: glycoside hydrolase family 3 N-terminal domain-containing protein [Oscillospiraceae bacterium]
MSHASSTSPATAAPVGRCNGADRQKTLSELEGCDLVPFSHHRLGGERRSSWSRLSYPNVTGSDTPADLSASIVTDILRDKLDYQNVIITDSHSMASITDHYSAGDAAVKALAAGCDMILMPSDLQAAFDAVKAAVADGTLSQARIDESVLRILTVKAEYGIIS